MDRVRRPRDGDVAMVRWKNYEEARAMFWSGLWHDIDSAHFDGREDDLTVRPLVVVDPENTADVERVRDALWRGGTVDDWQAALRSLANPTPPIEEPTGYGAVAEDADRQLWIHLEQGIWYCVRHGREDWAGVKAVRVLSEGVPAEAKS